MIVSDASEMTCETFIRLNSWWLYHFVPCNQQHHKTITKNHQYINLMLRLRFKKFLWFYIIVYFLQFLSILKNYFVELIFYYVIRYVIMMNIVKKKKIVRPSNEVQKLTNYKRQSKIQMLLNLFCPNIIV